MAQVSPTWRRFIIVASLLSLVAFTLLLSSSTEVNLMIPLFELSTELDEGRFYRLFMTDRSIAISNDDSYFAISCSSARCVEVWSDINHKPKHVSTVAFPEVLENISPYQEYAHVHFNEQRNLLVGSQYFVSEHSIANEKLGPILHGAWPRSKSLEDLGFDERLVRTVPEVLSSHRNCEWPIRCMAVCGNNHHLRLGVIGCFLAGGYKDADSFPKCLAIFEMDHMQFSDCRIPVDDSVSAVSFSSDGKLLAYGGYDFFEIADPATGAILQKTDLAGRCVSVVRFLPGNDKIVIGLTHSSSVLSIDGDSAPSIVLDVRSGDCVEHPLSGKRISAIEFSATGSHYAYGLDERLHVGSTTSWDDIATGRHESGTVRCVLFSPLGNYVASGSESNILSQVIVWNWKNGNLRFF